MPDYFAKIYNLLKQDKRLVLARIVRETGSAPRKAGAKCIILENGEIIGSVGGGVLEHRVLEEAKEVFQTGTSKLYHYQFLGNNKDNIEMVCGGTMDVYLEPVFPASPDQELIFKKIHQTLIAGNSGVLVTSITDGQAAGSGGSRIFIDEGQTSTGSIDGLSLDSLDLSGIKKGSLVEVDDKNIKLYVERVLPDEVLFIFGGGHISSYLAPMASLVGFHVVVIDDREDFANTQRFPEADEIKVIPFNEILLNIKITKRSYLAVMTRGHSHDKMVLGQVINTDAAYIGMIASKRKRKVVYDALIEEGIQKEKLEAVHSPIGLDIKAETPEEIAISVSAELIQVRALNRAALLY